MSCVIAAETKREPWELSVLRRAHS